MARDRTIILCPIVEDGKKVSCVYRVWFGSGHVYVGATCDLATRVKEHIAGINRGFAGNTKLPYLSHGDIFVRFEVVLLTSDPDVMSQVEQDQIAFFMKKGKCVNKNRASGYSSVGFYKREKHKRDKEILK
jgi:hypothetical protein